MIVRPLTMVGSAYSPENKRERCDEDIGPKEPQTMLRLMDTVFVTSQPDHEPVSEFSGVKGTKCKKSAIENFTREVDIPYSDTYDCSDIGQTHHR